MIKKILAILLALTMALSLYGCSQGETPESSSEPESSGTEETLLTEEDLADSIAAFNSVLAETFGAETEETGYIRLYKASGDETEEKLSASNAVPDALLPEDQISDFEGTQKDGEFDGYIIDPGYAICFKVTNFANIEEIRESLRPYMEDLVFESALQGNFIEFGGAAYLVRGGRGYGAESVDSPVITSQTTESLTADVNYCLFGEQLAKTHLTFKITDGKPVLTEAVTDDEQSGDSIGSASLEDLLGSVLTYEAGSAGSSLKALGIGVQLLNYSTATTLSTDEIAMAAETYKSTLSLEDMDVFASNFEEIKSACEVLWTDEAAGMLESAGITDAAESYDKTAAENFFAALGEKGA